MTVNNRRLWAVIPAAGSGLRYSASLDGNGGARKQFAEVAGSPVLLWSLQRIAGASAPVCVVVAVPEQEQDAVDRLVEDRIEGSLQVRVVAGGQTRQQSVSLAVAACDADDSDLILIHDAARPAVALEDIEAVVAAVVEAEPEADISGAVLGRAMTDTVKRISEGLLGATVDREQLFRVETPQVFRAGRLIRALARAESEEIRATDESTVVERDGGRILAVQASAENPKLTVAGDLARIERLLEPSLG